jgi:hypothetical protein
MTDIVERLRKIEGSASWYRNPDGLEAADEIERLRADLLTADGQNMELSARLATAERLLRICRERSDFDYDEDAKAVDAFLAGDSDE